jgi:predicted short-subunit dehydrogenase-like oxidoreductase (DUF2520 family)
MQSGDFREKGVAIIGPGRLGQAMGKLLHEAGVPILFVAARRLASARQAVRFIGSGQPIRLKAPELDDAQVILLTTTDTALAPLAADLAGGRAGCGNWSGKVVLHTCGSLPSAVLAPLKRRGAAIGSLHPFQTIPNPAAGVRNLPGCFWATEGDRAAQEVARGWVKTLGGVAFPVRSNQRTLYHLAAFLVCPTLVTLMERSVRLLKRAGVPAGVARPMLQRFVAETARNFAELGARRSLTGPAVRGDWPTVEHHLAALRRFSPELVPVYKALLNEMLRLAGRRLPRGKGRSQKSGVRSQKAEF